VDPQEHCGFQRRSRPRNDFGESAGSWSENTLVASPLSQGLIARAIGESGGRFGPSSFLSEDRGELSAEKRGLAFAKNAGADSITELRAIPAAKLLAVNSGSTGEVVDGWVLPDEIRNIYAQKKQNHVPILIGQNANEMTAVTDRGSIAKTVDEYRKRIAIQYGDMVKEYEAVYPVKTDADIARAVLDNNRDTTFSVHMRRWARASAAAGDKTYLYLFSHVPPHPDSAYLGAFHMSEIPYVFNNLNRIGVTYGGGQQENWRFIDLDRKLADQMSSYWVNFATAGDPDGKSLPKWTPYDLATEQYLDFGDTIVMRDHLLKAQCDFLDAFQSRQARNAGN
jgi:para-nitrobenzyl esterase